MQRKHKFALPAEWKKPDEDHKNCYFCLHQQIQNVDSSTMIQPVFRSLKDKANQVNQISENGEHMPSGKVKSRTKRSIARAKSTLTGKKSSIQKQSAAKKKSSAKKNPAINEIKRKRGRPRKILAPNGGSASAPNSSKASLTGESDSLADQVADRTVANRASDCSELGPEAVKQFSIAVSCPTLNFQKDLDELAINLVGASSSSSCFPLNNSIEPENEI